MPSSVYVLFCKQSLFYSASGITISVLDSDICNYFGLFHFLDFFRFLASSYCVWSVFFDCALVVSSISNCFFPVMPASSVAATRGDSEDGSQAWEEVAMATPDAAPVIPAEPVCTGGPALPPGTDSDLPSSDDCEGPSTKRRCYTYPPIWQVGIDWTGFSKSLPNK